jgi:glycerol kinase
MQAPPASTALPGLDREHRALLAQYGEIQKRCSNVIAAQAAEIARLQAQAVRLRAAAMMRESALAWEREDRQAMEAAIPGLPKRLTRAPGGMAGGPRA